MAYLRRIYRLPAALEDDLVAELWQAGTLGVSTEAEEGGGSEEGEVGGILRLSAYFALAARPDPPAPPSLDAPLTPLAPLAPLAPEIELLAEETLDDADWMAEYRRRSLPFALGRFLEIDPREPLAAPAPEDASKAAPRDPSKTPRVAALMPEGASPGASPPPPAPLAAAQPASTAGAPAPPRQRLRLPARTAFGVGSHESTALAVELLDALDLRGRSVLDVGTGTGILAFAALLRGAARAVAFDADPVAAFQAHANSRLNRLHPRLFAGRPGALSPAPAAACRFDVALVNVVPEQILPDLADLLPALADGARIVLSGLLAEHAPAVEARFAELGFAAGDRRGAGDWLAPRLDRAVSVGRGPGAAAAADATAGAGAAGRGPVPAS